MKTLGVRSVAAVGFAVLMMLGAGAPAAGARTAPTVSSFVGTYTTHAMFDGTTTWSRSVIHINADGTATDKAGHVASWVSQGRTITIDYSDASITEHLVGRQSRKGISSKRNPGTFTTTVGNGVWYAVKTA